MYLQARLLAAGDSFAKKQLSAKGELLFSSVEQVKLIHVHWLCFYMVLHDWGDFYTNKTFKIGCLELKSTSNTIPDKFTQQENGFSSPLIPDDLFNSWIIVSDKSGRINIFQDYCLVKICTDSHHLTNKTAIIIIII